MKWPPRSLSEYVDSLQSKGRYIFTQQQAIRDLVSSAATIRVAASRLIAKQRIVKLRFTLYLIVPLEYKAAGAPPASWYIDALMQHHKQPYYVALLSAAALHGAAHQQPQIFQVITNKPLRPAIIGRTKIEFIVKKNIEGSAVIPIKTTTGYMRVSTTETTAFDLIHYVKRSGYLNNVATVLTELSETIDPEKLLIAAKQEKLVVVQRTGYLIANYGKKETTNLLLQWLKTQRSSAIALRTDKEHVNKKRDPDWKVWVNEIIEID